MFEFKLPDLGEGIHEGELIKWHVNEGDHIREDQPLCDVETDKATVTIPSPKTGKIIRLQANPGDTVVVGSVMVQFEAVDTVETEMNNEQPAQDTDRKEVRKKVIAAPATRRLAREKGIDINQVQGSGPGGKVLKEDLEQFAGHPQEPVTIDSKRDHTAQRIHSGKKQLSNTPVSGIPFFEFEKLPDFDSQGPVDREPIRSLRKKTAVKTTTSMIMIPHVAHMEEIDVTELESLRKKFNEKKDLDFKLTLLAFVIKAATSLLKKYPSFNTSLDVENMEIVYKHFYHIGFAADTSKGLMVPVIQDADRHSVSGVAQKIRELAQKGREGSITVSELQNGTFTVTNVGAIGGTGMVPTINYPESAILGMGRVDKKPVVKDDEIVIRKMLPVTLSFDHRIADGAQAARFITELKQMLEDPVDFMVGV